MMSSPPPMALNFSTMPDTSFISSSCEISPFFILFCSLSVIFFIIVMIFLGSFMICAIMSLIDLLLSFSSKTSFKSSVNSSVNSFANLPSLPSIKVFMCSWRTSGFGNLKGRGSDDSSSSAAAAEAGVSSLFALSKNLPNPSMVSFILFCKSFSSIDSNILRASPKFDVSFTEPMTVTSKSCKYFQMEFFVFSLTPSQLNNSLKSTSGKNMVFASEV